MLQLLFAVLLGLIPALVAHGKGRSFVLWWIYGALLFIIALPHSLIMGSNQSELESRQLSGGMKKCPACAELVKADAKICRYCKHEFVEHVIQSREEMDFEEMIKHGIKRVGDKYVVHNAQFDALSDAISHARRTI